MAPKNKGVKISLHEFEQVMGCSGGGIILPSQSSEACTTDNDPEARGWYRSERSTGQRFESRRGGTHYEGSDPLEGKGDSIDDQANWRTGPRSMLNSSFNSSRDTSCPSSTPEFLTRDDLGSRCVDKTNAPVSSFSSASHLRRGQGAFRKVEPEVDFSTVRDGPRRQLKGQSSFDTARGASSRTSFFQRFSQDKAGDDDTLCWRNRPSRTFNAPSSISRPGLMNRPACSSTSQPSGNHAGIAPRDRDLNSMGTKLAQDEGTGEAVSSTVRSNEIKWDAVWHPESVVESRSATETRKHHESQSPVALEETTMEDKAGTSTTQDVPQDPILTQTDSTTSNVSALTSTPVAEKFEQVKSVDIKPDVITSVANPTESTPFIGSLSISETETPSAPSVEQEKSSAPWRPPHIRDQQAKATNNSTKVYKSIEALVKDKSAQIKPSVANVSGSVTHFGAEKTDVAKEAYRRNLLQKEQRKKDEEEQKRLKRLEAERVELLALERLMYGDAQKAKILQDVVEEGLALGDPKTLLDSFTALLTHNDITSLVPSIILVKCLIRRTIDVLAPLANDNKVTDLERMDKEASIVDILKPTMLFLFEKGGIKLHKLRILFEIQRFIHAMKFPRLSSGLTLIEVIWDALYMQDVIEEQYFLLWYSDVTDETPGRPNLLFQMLGWFNWLNSASVEGYDQENGSSEAGGDDSDEDDF